MPNIDVIVVGLPELQAQLDKLDDVGKTIGPALLASGNELRTWIAKYPPTTEANAPKAPGRWYERGKGSMYARRDGTVRMVKKSELLNRRWSTKHGFSKAEAWVRIGNSASYSRFVHDKEYQPEFHARRGWRTAQAGIEQFRARIVARVEAAIKAIVR